MSVYDNKPEQFFKLIIPEAPSSEKDNVFCAGFELKAWRCDGFARHLIEWLPDFALSYDLLSSMTHSNAYGRLREAAARVYKTTKHGKRGEVGEITAHAICRQFFNTVPISPRIHYKSASNDVVKGFDLVHAKTDEQGLEVWFGEAKTYQDRAKAVADAISSVKGHIEAGFLSNEKLLLGPQIPKEAPQREQLISLFQANTPLDELLEKAVFPIIILAESQAIAGPKEAAALYAEEVRKELEALSNAILASELRTKITVPLIYVPLESKAALIDAFDQRLKGVQ